MVGARIIIFMCAIAGKIFQLTRTAAICRPAGNTATSKNKFGEASVNILVKCQQGRVWFEDTTNASYKGLTGVQGSSTLRMTYPFDETGTIPDPFQISFFSTALCYR